VKNERLKEHYAIVKYLHSFQLIDVEAKDAYDESAVSFLKRDHPAAHAYVTEGLPHGKY
jgi:hypothetical protein